MFLFIHIEWLLQIYEYIRSWTIAFVPDFRPTSISVLVLRLPLFAHSVDLSVA